MRLKRISAIMLAAAMLTGCAGNMTAGSVQESGTSPEKASTTVPLSELEDDDEKIQSENSVSENKTDKGINSEKVEKILSEMTTEEKIAQMIMPSVRNEGNKDGASITTFTSDVEETIKKYGFGGYIFFAPNCEDTYKLAALTEKMQRAACSDDSEVKLPLLLGIDQEGGIVNRMKDGTVTPGNMALAATGDTKYALEAGDIIGSELAAAGLNVDFAPVMDVNSNKNNPIIGLRSFSDDAETAAEYGEAFIEGIEQNNVSTSLKHFPGHGDTSTDSHTGLPKIDKSETELEANELIPFKAGIDAGTDMIMTAHIQFPQIETETYVSKSTGQKISLPATLSKKILTELLRDKMGFDGVIVTDSMIMEAITEHFDEIDAAKLAINAGADILLMPGDIASESGIIHLEKYVKSVAALVDSGEISEDRVNASVARILTLKEKKGLLDRIESYRDMTDEDIALFAENAQKAIGSDENKEKESEIAEAAVTLVCKSNTVSDDAAVSSNSAVSQNDAVSENAAVSADYVINEGRTAVLAPDSDILEIAKASGMKADYGLYDKAISDYDNIVIISVLKASKDDTASVRQMIRKAEASGRKCVVISAGLPYDTEKYEEADGVLVCYGYTKRTPNIKAALRAAFGEFVPTGVLPVKSE